MQFMLQDTASLHCYDHLKRLQKGALLLCPTPGEQLAKSSYIAVISASG